MIIHDKKKIWFDYPKYGYIVEIQICLYYHFDWVHGVKYLENSVKYRKQCQKCTLKLVGKWSIKRMVGHVQDLICSYFPIYYC